MGKSLSNNGSWARGATVLCRLEPWCQAGEGIEQSHFVISYPGGSFQILGSSCSAVPYKLLSRVGTPQASDSPQGS